MKLSKSFNFFMTVLAPLAVSVDATYSIIATDQATGQVGVAATTCRMDSGDPSDFKDDYVLIPGRGVAAAQAYAPSSQAVDAANELASDDKTTLEEAVSSVSAANDEQIAVVDMNDSYVFTGPSASSDYDGDDKGQKKPDYVYSVQGNDLTSEKVIKQAKKKFSEPKGCDLADRLMRALEAGSKHGEGDVDCPAGTWSTNIAYLKVINPDGTDVVQDASGDPLFVGLDYSDSGESAIEALLEAYKDWRKDNKCEKRPKPHLVPPLAAASILAFLGLGIVLRKRKILGSTGKQTNSNHDVAGIHLPEPVTPYVKDNSVV